MKFLSMSVFCFFMISKSFAAEIKTVTETVVKGNKLSETTILVPGGGSVTSISCDDNITVDCFKQITTTITNASVQPGDHTRLETYNEFGQVVTVIEGGWGTYSETPLSESVKKYEYQLSALPE